jgi:recombination protein RecA
MVMERRAIATKSHPGYFQDSSITFFSTGCTLLDMVLGGGWALGRVVNLVGDKSTGKTLLAIEAATNFLKKFPTASAAYRESEAAFSDEYAVKQLGLPFDRIVHGDKLIETVEDFFEDLDGTDKKPGFLDTVGPSGGLYILDSLDALSDRDEMDRAMDKGSYGTAKARKMSELFRRLVQKIEKKNVTLLIVSQVRENIGVTFGRKYTRSGGKALDFYASQVIYLAQKRTIDKTIKGVTRPIGVEIKAKNDKNKCGLPYRECEFTIEFGYGVDDFGANLSWLFEVKHVNGPVVDLVGSLKEQRDVNKVISDMRMLTSKEEYAEYNSILSKEVITHWQAVETEFLPKRRKY